MALNLLLIKKTHTHGVMFNIREMKLRLDATDLFSVDHKVILVTKEIKFIQNAQPWKILTP